jgi:betaine-aldehyde dehydrogenase
MTAATTHAAERDGIFVDNAWAPSSSASWLDVIDPSTEERVARVKEPTTDEVDAAVASARRALEDPAWAGLSPDARADILEAIADGIDANSAELQALTVAEVGAPVSVAPFHPGSASWLFRYYAKQARTFSFRDDRAREDGGTTRVLREPVGVVAAIVPWNGPIIVAALKLAPALAAGCTAILKPAPNTPLASYRLAEIMAEAGLPAGVVNVLAADRAVSEYLADHPGIDKVSFTGSAAVGRRLMALCADRLARVTLELGGKSAAIVADDIALDAVLPSLIPGGCQSTGQACVALSRVLVSEQRHDELVEAMKDAFEAMRLGSAHDPETEMGPLALERQRDRVEGYIELAREEGATIVTGGGRPAGLDRGYFVEPTLLTDVDNAMRVAQEEIFGPVISVIRYKDLDDAVRIANESPYGLCGSVYTADPERGFEIARRVRTGMITVNSFIIDFNSPFGGYKCSGQGREGGPEGLAEFVEPKTVHMLPTVGA